MGDFFAEEVFADEGVVIDSFGGVFAVDLSVPEFVFSSCGEDLFAPAVEELELEGFEYVKVGFELVVESVVVGGECVGDEGCAFGYGYVQGDVA